MSKFKVGDTVRRVDPTSQHLPVGYVGKVTAVSLCGGGVKVDNHPFGYFNPNNFELVQATTEQPAVLTPLEVAEYLLAGTPELEYSYGGNGDWYAVKHPHLMSIRTVQERTFRKKPTTVLINGISVPAPMTHLEIADCEDRRTGYYIELARGHIYTKRILSGQRVWRTKEEAQEVLDAIMTSFSK